jgi:hypothetical protein
MLGIVSHVGLGQGAILTKKAGLISRCLGYGAFVAAGTHAS